MDRKFLSIPFCMLVLLGSLASGTVSRPMASASTNGVTSSGSPVIVDFYINNTWAGQICQFSFEVASGFGLDNAVFGCNVTQSFVNDSAASLSGTQAWANFTHALPSYNCAISFQLWVWDVNSSNSATTGFRCMRVKTYNNVSSAWNTPFSSLSDAIRAVETSNDWSNVDIYSEVVLDQLPITKLEELIDNYTVAQDWVNVLRWSAIIEKLNLTWANKVNDILYALGNYTMVGALPYTSKDGTDNIFSPEHKWALYGYYYALQYGGNLTKWNVTAAYQQFNSSVYYSINNWNETQKQGCPIYVYADGSARSFLDRYYDEDAGTIECYVLFYSLSNSSVFMYRDDALNQASNIWLYLNEKHWNPQTYPLAFPSWANLTYYRYSPWQNTTGAFECETGFFLKVISTLKYYSPNLPNYTRVIQDIGTRFLSSEWQSYQWYDALLNRTAYAVVHQNTGESNTSNTQRRLYNTLAAWQALFGAYLKLNSTQQANMKDMLMGNQNTQPAWALLLTPYPDAYLFVNSTTMFNEASGVGLGDANATAIGEILLLMLGIVPQNATVAFPLEELDYEYIQDVDPQLFQFNLTTRTITLAVASPGSLTFQYGISPITCNLNQSGLWQLTFSNSWNMITNATYFSSLPTNRIYYTVNLPGDINGDFNVTLEDLVLLANAYGSRPGDFKWNPNADINGNGVVDLADLVTLANHYGQHNP